MRNKKVGEPGLAEFSNSFRDKGWHFFPEYLDPDFTDGLAVELDEADRVFEEIKQRKGLGSTNGTLHHLVVRGGRFMDLLRIDPLHAQIRSYFGGNYILNSYGGVLNVRERSTYVSNIHRDTRFFTKDVNLMLNMLVMLNDFTLENGATYVLSGSHRSVERPAADHFYKHSDRMVGKKGTIVLWNSNLWHSAAPNTTDQPRRCLTLTYSRPWLKQQMDYPRALGYDLADKIPENLLQVLGYNARIPASFDEWFRPQESRFYRLGQDL